MSDDDIIISRLQKYTACDVSDALLKLKVPNAGFIPDLSPYTHSSESSRSKSPTPSASTSGVTVAPLSTVLFVPKTSSSSSNHDSSSSSLPPRNIPSDAHWADLTVPGTFVLMKQPPGQANAICGGIMALRMKVLGAKGIVVAGRVRDVTELRGTGLPVWARGLSTVGAGGGSTPWATQVELDINGTVARPGDLAVSDPVNGVVVIPQDRVAQVLELLPRLTSADDGAKEDVAKGLPVFDAFKRHRSNL